MPEIWLKYGTTDVALDIKFGNLLAQVFPGIPLMSDEDIAATIGNVPMSNNMLILALSRSKPVQSIVQMLQVMTQSRGFEGVHVDVVRKLPNRESNEGFNLGSHECPLFLGRRYENVIFVSRTSYDPLFGFSGTPTILLRYYMQERMLSAFESRQSNLPNPGVYCPPLSVALSASEELSATSVELVASDSGISAIYSGNICDGFRKAREKLTSITTVEVDYAKSAIACGSNEADFSNLNASLNLLWNSAHAIQEEGSIILLAENRDGLGEGALQMVVEGKMRIEDCDKKGFYVPGLEHLLYMQNLSHQYDLGILSTLPHYYLKKLGFETYGATKDVLQKLLAKHGKNHKILVSSAADVALLKLREQTRIDPA
ncbi:MAG TPA: hypothetical protein VFI73_04920 [Candidatus Nitrosopolaris sp.]|nr:hypothetical protein [Candidatus Nitrosopolaris sp.]